MIEKLPFGNRIKNYLESSDRYQRWKYSEPGLWLWRQFARQHDTVIQSEAHYFQSLLQTLRSNKMPIFDIGANVGWVSKVFLGFTQKLVAVEPDSFCQKILINRFGKSKDFLLVPKAVSDAEGYKEFLIQEEGSALNTFSEKWKKELESEFFFKSFLFTAEKLKVPTTTIDRLIAQHGLPSLAKIDVEGHELEVFKGLSHRIPLLVFEANLPVFWEETQQIIQILTKLDETVVFNYSLDFEIMLSQYVEPNALIKILGEADKCSIDIICRMSNYPDYFKLE